ncbi:MAG: endonuclease domain-containing protein [Bacteroidales bacterium]|nr:endonuclease domain-containing protein [Bacteroidales bacterium]
MFFGAPPYLFQYAKELRIHPTKAEKLLWEKLKNKQLGVKFRRQHPVADYIVDFYCHNLKFAIEIDGGYHFVKDQNEYDQYRAKDLSELGIKIIRFFNSQIENDIEEVIIKIKQQIALRTPNP